MIDRSKIEAAMAEGVLTVTMPKVEKVKPRRIPIKVGE
jgi:HSP20 family protein